MVPLSKQRDWRATRNTGMSLPVALGEMLLCRAKSPGGPRVPALSRSGCWGWVAAPQCLFCCRAALRAHLGPCRLIPSKGLQWPCLAMEEALLLTRWVLEEKATLCSG